VGGGDGAGLARRRLTYLPAARRCQRVAFNIFLCFFFRILLRRFFMREPTARHPSRSHHTGPGGPHRGPLLGDIRGANLSAPRVPPNEAGTHGRVDKSQQADSEDDW
jgi:hypothetical protein